jgi:hypothetical protein
MLQEVETSLMNGFHDALLSANLARKKPAREELCA